MNIFFAYLWIEFLKLRHSKSFWAIITGILIFSMLVFIELRSTIQEKFQAVSWVKPDQDFVDFFLKRLANRLQLIGYSGILLVTMVSVEIDLRSLFLKNRMQITPINMWLFSLCKALACSIITLVTWIIIFAFMPSFINSTLTRHNYPKTELFFGQVTLVNIPTLLLFFLLIALFYMAFIIFFNYKMIVSSILFVSICFLTNALLFYPTPLYFDYNPIKPIAISVHDNFILLSLIMLVLLMIQYFTRRNYG